MKRIAVALFGVGMALASTAQVRVTVGDTSIRQLISPEIYGQFAEHLGSCIYGGIWVGKDSPIPNVNGYRLDVLNALRQLHVPVLRWPGGCFADDYHWRDGIGDPGKRPRRVNNWWGGSVEDNSFGTHEFLDLCEMLGCEPYISGNVGSGTVEEMSSWVEYMTSDADSPMANLRRLNGRDKPWKVKYFGIGNESWGCGGNMRPEYYANLFRQYGTYCRNYGGNTLFKVASGANAGDYGWTNVLMRDIGDQMQGVSLHYYTVKTWTGSKGAATSFSPDDYYLTLRQCIYIDTLIRKHVAVMDRYDAGRKVALMVDEWGTWFDVEPSTNPGHLFQQNTMRDAMVAALSLNIFHKYSDRVKMANIAQVVNVLQAMILTRGDSMLLTPTYHVFKMYSVHQGGRYIPLTVSTPTVGLTTGIALPAVSATASKDASGITHVSLVNIDLNSSQEVTLELPTGARVTEATILTSINITDHNTFRLPNAVKPAKFHSFKTGKGEIIVKLPAHSIVTLAIH